LRVKENSIMRAFRVAAVALMAALCLYAVDPLVGTWMLNLEKSKYPEGLAPKEQTVIIQLQDDEHHVSISGMTASGKPISARYTAPVNGGEGKVQQSTTFDAVASKRISDTQRQLVYSQGGKETTTINVMLSADKSSLRIIGKGKDSEGKPTEYVAVFDRQ
jgi:hypothetical protein